MCDNLSLYKTYIPPPTLVSSTESISMPPQFYSINNDDEQHQSYTGSKRKYSDYEDNTTSLTNLEHVSTSFACNNSDDEEDEDDDEGSSGDDELTSDDESNNTDPMTRVTAPCTITQRRHSDTIHTSSPTLSYGTPIVKRRCTYSSMHDEEQKRSVLVESYRKLRGVKKPKLQVSLLICNLIKRLEKTFTKTPPPSRLQPQQQQQQQQVQYYQPRTTYRSSSTDSIYMPTSLGNDDIETTPINQQYSPPHTSSYDSDNVLLPVGDLRSTNSMYHPSSTDAYWLAQSNFAIPVVSTSDDDVDASLQGGGDYLDLSDNTLASSFSSCSSSSPSVSSPSSPSSELLSPPPSSSSSSTISNDCCCSVTPSPALTKLLVDTNNNNNDDDDYYVYHHHHQQHQHQHHHHQHQHQQHHHQHHHHHHHHHAQIHSNQDFHSHHHSSISEQAFFYHHNGNNTVDIITTA